MTLAESRRICAEALALGPTLWPRADRAYPAHFNPAYVSKLLDQTTPLELLLDAMERERAGFPIASEEWYARRDAARAALSALEQK